MQKIIHEPVLQRTAITAKNSSTDDPEGKQISYNCQTSVQKLRTDAVGYVIHDFITQLY